MLRMHLHLAFGTARLGYCSDMRTEVGGNTGHPSLYHR